MKQIIALIATLIVTIPYSKIAASQNDYLEVSKGSMRVPDPEKQLRKSGFTPSDANSLRDALNSPRFIIQFYALGVILEKHVVTLTSDVQHLYLSLEGEIDRAQSEVKDAMQKNADQSVIDKLEEKAHHKEFLSETLRMRCLEVIFTLDSSITDKMKQRYLASIRRSLFQRDIRTGEGAPVWAFDPLIAAHRYDDVDIKQDLMLIIKANRFPSETKTLPMIALLKLYKDNLAEREMTDVLNSLKPDPITYNRFIALAHQKGMLRTVEPIK